MEAMVLCFLLENGNFRFQVGRLNIGDQTPLKTGTKALFNRVDVLWQAVRGDDNLLLLLIQGVKGVEELFLRALFPGDELDVVHKKDIYRVEAVAETDHTVEAQRVDDFDGKFFGADVAEAHR